MSRFRIGRLACATLLASGLSSARAQDGNLAQQAQNPIANLISIPFQNNTNFGVGPFENDQNILNIQPVIPFTLNEDWNLVTRWILPVVYQPPVYHGDESDFGLGNFNPSFFFVNQVSPTLMVGAGPTFLLPTATDSSLGPEKWGAGPTAAIVWTPGKWVVGALVNNIWSFAGDSSDPDVNAFLFQYFVNYNLKHGWYLTSAPIMTANWEAPTDDQWTLPLGGGVGRVFNIGSQPVNMSLQAYDNVITPEGGPDWQARFQVQLLFPTGG
ncbi:neuromedin U [Methyloceanibacter sp.]|uniref:neuromedin U n=1 Tax=Methyloceanibacter sp. TaxID=1965321 RepID=UPI002CF97B96|nr:neuromedin U [Methyloceanibacter sp.]HML91224.1 neuromedin U [Methyloceanibacter sp.]